MHTWLNFEERASMAGKSEDLEDRPTKKHHLLLALCKCHQFSE